MIGNLFRGLFDTSTVQVISVGTFLACVAAALLVGIFFAGIYMYKSRYTPSFVITLALLPAVVCVVIMMVNGNVGAGVAVAGTFSLVRFRSVPGTAKEIGTIFLAMAAGLICGMGYLAYGILFSLVMGGFFVLYTKVGLGQRRKQEREKVIHITIPEDLDYTDLFRDLMEMYTDRAELVQVKTTNLGSLFKLTYHITEKDPAKEKEMIDQIRCRNGNLEVNISNQDNTVMEL